MITIFHFQTKHDGSQNLCVLHLHKLREQSSTLLRYHRRKKFRFLQLILILQLSRILSNTCNVPSRQRTLPLNLSTRNHSTAHILPQTLPSHHIIPNQKPHPLPTLDPPNPLPFHRLQTNKQNKHQTNLSLTPTLPPQKTPKSYAIIPISIPNPKSFPASIPLPTISNSHLTNFAKRHDQSLCRMGFAR